MKTVFFGATSDLVKAYLRLPEFKHDAILVARNVERLIPLKRDLEVRKSIAVQLLEMDLQQLSSDDLEELRTLAADTEHLFFAVGHLGDNRGEIGELYLSLCVNFLNPALVLEIFARVYKERDKGQITLLSSVAGERGRRSNYVYGSAKAGLTAYSSGLRNYLHGTGVRVLTVKPGFMNTSMTVGMDLNPMLTAQPKEAARAIFKAEQSGRDVLYVKWIWRYIMWLIKQLPEGVFKRIKW